MTNSVVSFEVRTTTSNNSRLVRHHFSCAISDHFINSIGLMRRYSCQYLGMSKLNFDPQIRYLRDLQLASI